MVKVCNSGFDIKYCNSDGFFEIIAFYDLGFGLNSFCIVLPYVCLDDFKAAEWPRFQFWDRNCSLN